MSGREGARGYVYQAIIAVLKSLENDKWDRIKVEPLTENDKVDIVLQNYGVIIKAIQVKSSKNKFEKPSIERWLKELKEDINSEKYELVLVGNSFTEPAREYIREINNTTSDTITIEEYDEKKLIKELTI